VFPGARYLLFGFGDRHYLLARGRGLSLLRALLPGPGIVLVTGLPLLPEIDEPADQSSVIRLDLSVQQSGKLQTFIWNSLSRRDGAAVPVQQGPYPGSLYYETPLRYSALHTCNTWAAEALRSAELPVRSAGVGLAGQLWHQVQRMQRAQRAGLPRGTPQRSTPVSHLQGGLCHPRTPAWLPIGANDDRCPGRRRIAAADASGQAKEAGTRHPQRISLSGSLS
jgi:hypothetical protein